MKLKRKRVKICENEENRTEEELMKKKLWDTDTNMDGVCHNKKPGDEKEQSVKEHQEADTDTGKI